MDDGGFSSFLSSDTDIEMVSVSSVRQMSVAEARHRFFEATKEDDIGLIRQTFEDYIHLTIKFFFIINFLIEYFYRSFILATKTTKIGTNRQ